MQIESIKQKLFELKKKDIKLSVFGAQKHKYKLYTPKKEIEIKNFEENYNLKLPPGYRDFLLQIGNGGAGPYFGLEPLESSLFVDLDYGEESGLIDPTKAFPLNEKWNLNFENLEDEKYFEIKDEEYFDNKWVNGLLRVSNFGCGVSINLVVNGVEYGNIWIDDRCNDGGIYPDKSINSENRLNFLNWYEQWLDKSLSEIS